LNYSRENKKERLKILRQSKSIKKKWSLVGSLVFMCKFI
jgi:hypothetical protein